MQYIGRLMRDVDPAPLEAAFARWSEGPAEERARFAALERWRAELMEDAAALDDFVAAHPGSDRTALARLVAEARDERVRGGPPHHQRALFRALKKADAARASGAAAGPSDGDSDAVIADDDART
jgi:ribosome-associated protein